MKYDEKAMQLILSIVKNAYEKDVIDYKDYYRIIRFLDFIKWGNE